MKLLPLIIFLLSSFSVFAESLTTRIYSVERSSDGKSPHLIYFEDGRVGFLSQSDKTDLPVGEWLNVELDSKGNFLGASSVAAPKSFALHDPEPEAEPVPEPITYDPTNLGSQEEASTIFRRMNRNHQRSSQCYNRAHIWAYEEFRRSSFHSVKLFMFFTRSYIRKYRYKWWFHVTPLTYVNGTAMTLDRTFMRWPVGIKTWTDNFIYSKRTCPIISRYSDYRNNQEAEHCYLHPASMYFWQPRDLERMEQTGYQKTQFIKSEINWAYREAF